MSIILDIMLVMMLYMPIYTVYFFQFSGLQNSGACLHWW